MSAHSPTRPTVPARQRRTVALAALGWAVGGALLLPRPAQAQSEAGPQPGRGAAGAGESAAAAPATAPRAGPPAAPPVGYRVGAGDELNFRFTHTPELNTVAVVRADGRVSLPLAGEMPAAGLSLRELAEQVQAALSRRVRRPEVVINVQGSQPSQRVFVGGEVGRPGVQSLAGALTVLQAVMAAEGFKDSAQPRAVKVVRTAPGAAPQVFTVDIQALMDGRDGAQDMVLAPYDVVVVPKSGIANVGLWVDQYIRRVLPVNLGFSYTVGAGTFR